jgi:nucleotide-binding universal stress UspA family protein
MYKNILFPIDISDKNSWKDVFPTVLGMVKAFDAKITIMTVVQDYGHGLMQQYFPKGWVEDVTKKSKAELSKIIDSKVPKDVEVAQQVSRGAVYQEILDHAEKIGADLIVLSANRPELRDYLLGPNAAKVVRHAKISVLVVRN